MDWREAFVEVGELIFFRLPAKGLRKPLKWQKKKLKDYYSRTICMPNCGEKNAANALFCNKCGKKSR